MFPKTVPPLTRAAASSRRMSRQRTRDTTPEMAVRRLLYARGLRYRVNLPIPGLPRRRADLTFPAQRGAVLVDGCFWHGCPEHKTSPKANAAWWEAKLHRNIQRDRETDQYLVAMGWTVVRIWEHEASDLAADRVEATVRSRSQGDIAGAPGAENVEIVIEVRAENAEGFTDGLARTVRENNRVLRFDLSEFEDVEW